MKLSGLSEFVEFVENHKAAVERKLEQILPEPAGEDAVLKEAMRHSALGGGKRLRAMLCLAAYAMGRSKVDDAILGVAASIEALHAFTLVHDDLPCMDDDDFRRGVPSCHKKYGEAVALLAGDALHNLGYRAFIESARQVYPPAVAMEALGELAQGMGEVVAGQTADVLSEGKDIGRDALKFIHTNKTASLIRSSILCGGILGQLGADRLTKLRKFSLEIGLAFQIVDDILGAVGDFKTTGKQGRSDEAKNKPTYVREFGLEGSASEARVAHCRALTHLSGVEDAAVLAGFADYLISRLPPDLIAEP